MGSKPVAMAAVWNKSAAWIPTVRRRRHPADRRAERDPVRTSSPPVFLLWQKQEYVCFWVFFIKEIGIIIGSRCNRFCFVS